MSNDINACQRAKEFIDYMEAFSFANSLTDSIKDEVMSIDYQAQFGIYLLSINVQFYKNTISASVVWKQYQRHKFAINDKEVREKYRRIISLVKVVSSVDPLKDIMSFTVTDFGELNLLIDLLTEGI